MFVCMYVCMYVCLYVWMRIDEKKRKKDRRVYYIAHVCVEEGGGGFVGFHTLLIQ